MSLSGPEHSGYAPGPERLNRLHHAAQFGQALEAPNKRIAGIDAHLPVVAEQVPMVEAHHYPGVEPEHSWLNDLSTIRELLTITVCNEYLDKGLISR
jgi:acetylornithine deacetylase/succinyl-diaminopimelate desuccinylase-like protein